MIELNEVLLSGEERTLSLMAEGGQMTCLAGGSRDRRSRWLQAILGMEPVRVGLISVDGEPLTARTVSELRAMMSYVPERLVAEGQVVSYEPPTVQDLFLLRANRHQPISNGILAEEMRRTGIADADAARWLAAVALLGRPILLVDHPSADSLPYLLRLAREQRRTVVVASDDAAVRAASDQVIEL